MKTFVSITWKVIFSQKDFVSDQNERYFRTFFFMIMCPCRKHQLKSYFFNSLFKKDFVSDQLSQKRTLFQNVFLKGPVGKENFVKAPQYWHGGCVGYLLLWGESAGEQASFVWGACWMLTWALCVSKFCMFLSKIQGVVKRDRTTQELRRRKGSARWCLVKNLRPQGLLLTLTGLLSVYIHIYIYTIYMHAMF